MRDAREALRAPMVFTTQIATVKVVPVKVESGKLKVPVSVRALIARVNRKLVERGEVVRRTHPVHDEDGNPLYNNDQLGQFFRVSMRQEALVETHVDLEKFARELGVLALWEGLQL